MSDDPRTSDAPRAAPATDAASADEPSPPPARRRREPDDEGGGGRRGLLLAIPLVTIAAGVVGFVLFGMEDKGIYSKPIDQLVAEKARFAGRTVRAEGALVKGTLVKRESPCEHRFTIEKNGVQVPVRYPQCVVPDTFRDVPGMDVSVTVEGTLAQSGTFEATSVLAKCPSKYEMKDRAARGEAAPHAAPATM